jgi:hypothetical protein
MGPLYRRWLNQEVLMATYTTLPVSQGLSLANPFVALGVAGHELSYSQAIANLLFQDHGYLDNLAQRLGLQSPLRFTSVKAEVTIGRDRLDIVASDGNRLVVVETKVKAQVDVGQQERYLKAVAGRYTEAQKTFLAFKLGPAVARECIPEFQLLTSADVLADLPPGDFHGLRAMLEVFNTLSARLAADPASVWERLEGQRGDPLEQFLVQHHLGAAVYDHLYDALQRKVEAQLVGGKLKSWFGVSARGGAILQLFRPRWQDLGRGVFVHFELLQGEKIALHVETEPYQPGAAEAWKLKAKTALVLDLRETLDQHPSFKKPGLRKDFKTESCTTIATLALTYRDLDRSAASIAEAFTLLTAEIDAAVAKLPVP